MRLATRRPGTSTTFIDSPSGEDIFQVALDEAGQAFMAYHLYDAAGKLVAESDGLEQYAAGLCVRSLSGELLLGVPTDSEENFEYRFYNRSGTLLTSSDGIRTLIGPLLRMEGTGRNWVVPFPKRTE